jgi:hypothetical protein
MLSSSLLALAVACASPGDRVESVLVRGARAAFCLRGSERCVALDLEHGTWRLATDGETDPPGEGYPQVTLAGGEARVCAAAGRCRGVGVPGSPSGAAVSGDGRSLLVYRDGTERGVAIETYRVADGRRLGRFTVGGGRRGECGGASFAGESVLARWGYCGLWQQRAALHRLDGARLGLVGGPGFNLGASAPAGTHRIAFVDANGLAVVFHDPRTGRLLARVPLYALRRSVAPRGPDEVELPALASAPRGRVLVVLTGGARVGDAALVDASRRAPERVFELPRCSR